MPPTTTNNHHHHTNKQTTPFLLHKVLWVYPPTGYGDDFTAYLESLAMNNSHGVTLLFGLLFPLVHSGLASLRSFAEPIVGARVWRVVFAFPSLCLSFSWLTYFIAHAHDGVTFWDLQVNVIGVVIVDVVVEHVLGPISCFRCCGG